MVWYHCHSKSESVTHYKSDSATIIIKVKVATLDVHMYTGTACTLFYGHGPHWYKKANFLLSF